MGDKPKRGLSDEQRRDARRSHERGESLQSISRRLGCRYATLQAMAKREAWTVSPTVSLRGPAETKRMRQRAQAKVVDIATGKAVEAVTETIIDEIAAMSKATKLAAEYMVGVLIRASTGAIKPSEGQTEADVAAKVMGAYATLTKAQRDNAGLRQGQPTAPVEGRADRRFEFTVDEEALAEARRLAEAG